MPTVEFTRKLADSQSLLFKKSLDKGDVVDALTHAALMLNSLGDITDPEHYEEMESRCAEEMSYLSKWIKMNKVESLYEIVQYVPGGYARLYLMWGTSGDDPAYLEDIQDMASAIQQPLHGFYFRMRVGGHSLVKFGWLNILWVRIRHQFAYKDTHKQIRSKLLPQIQNVLQTLVQIPDSIVPLLKHAVMSQDSLSQTTIALSIARLSPFLHQYSREFLSSLSKFIADIIPLLNAFFHSIEEYLFNNYDPKVFKECFDGTCELMNTTSSTIQILKICTLFSAICPNYVTFDNLCDLLRLLNDRINDASTEESQLILQFLIKVVGLSPNLSLLIKNECFIRLSTIIVADKQILMSQIARNVIPDQNFMPLFSYLLSNMEECSEEYNQSLALLIHSVSPVQEDYLEIMDSVYAIVKNKCVSLVPVIIHKWILYCYSNECVQGMVDAVLGALNVLLQSDYDFMCANLAMLTLLCFDQTDTDCQTAENLIEIVEKSIYNVEAKSRLHIFLNVVSALTYIKNIPIETFATRLTALAIELDESDQSTAIIACCRLYMESSNKKMMSCVKKALKVAGNCSDTDEQCRFILDVVNHIICFRDGDILDVDCEIVEECISRVESKLENTKDDDLMRYFTNLSTTISQWN